MAPSDRPSEAENELPCFVFVMAYNTLLIAWAIYKASH